MNEVCNKYYLDAVNQIEAATAEMDLVGRHIEAATHRINMLSQRLVNVDKNIHFLRKEWTIVSLYQFSLAKKERRDLHEQLVGLKNERIRLTHVRDSISVHIVNIQKKLPSLQSKVIRLRND